MTKVIVQTYNLANEYRSKLALAMLVSAAALMVFYAIQVYVVVSRTVAVEKLENHIAMLSSDLNKLDSTYLGMSRSITPDMMADYGLTAGEVTAYIQPSPSAAAGVLAAAGHEF